MSKNNYNSSDIKILKGLEAVRVRPGMYIGSTDIRGLHHTLWEIVDNAIDEAANGFANLIKVCLYPDGSASVEDNGRGIPTDIHPVAKCSGVEVVFTQLHAGGKFNNDNYNYSGGLHGVGASVTNALSEWLKVEVYKDGTTYAMEFKTKKDGKGKVVPGAAVKKLEDIKKKTKKTGTFVQFKPDADVFDTVEFSFEMISKRLRELAFLNKGLKIYLTDTRNKDNIIEEEYSYSGGISDYITYVNEGKVTLYPKPFYGSCTRGDMKIEFAFQHTDGYTENMFSFVNNIRTPEGGTHDAGFKAGLTSVFTEYAKGKRINVDFKGEDFREGITAVILVKMKDVQFEGQTKIKLGNNSVTNIVKAAVADMLNDLMVEKGFAKASEAILKKAMRAAEIRKKQSEIRKDKTAMKDAESAKLVGKLAPCSSRTAELNELFIVEGDSAGGSAKQGRDRQHQAILPLRGKPLNSEKKRLSEVLANEEIRTIITALDTGIGEEMNMAKLKFHKVIILSDADQDGAHIRAILLTFFYRHMRKLVEEGHVYIGMPPLYKVYKKDVVEYAYDDKQLQEKIDKVGKNYSLQRYKGLGEMNPEQLWDTTMNPQTRMLMQVSIEDAATAERRISTLMGDNINDRKKYIQEYANFNKVDTFMEKIDKKAE